MFQEPNPYWENLRRQIEFRQLEENWLIQCADISVWVGFWLIGAACLAGLTSIALSI
jgi:hypothetical protein